jgi:predicted RNA-binding protein YlxR (DUF448 family)
MSHGRAIGRPYDVRGAYLHPDPGCIEQARKRRGLERALRGQVEEEVWTVLGRIIGSV